MRLSSILFIVISLASVQAWFGSNTPKYKQWSPEELQNWLKEHNIDFSPSYSKAQLQSLVESKWESASGWTEDQYTRAQKSFQGLRESSFDAWDESRLRSFLVEQGAVAPSGPREQLVLKAKEQYRKFQDVASSFASSASSLSSQASASASTVLHSQWIYQPLDDAKDYIYSTWDDSRLESYLREKGVLQEKSSRARSELLTMMRDAYAKVADPIWEAWSDSYMRRWLMDHKIIKSDDKRDRRALTALMGSYYYDVSDRVWKTWSDSDLKNWLVNHDIIKSEAEIAREKLVRLVADNYQSASDTIWGGWSEKDIQAWLTAHGYLKPDSKHTREELVRLINDKYRDISTRSAEYLTWPDARLRAYLRQQGINEAELPLGRPSLLQEVRIRWVQTSSGAEALLGKIREMVNNGVEAAEERIYELLGGKVHQVEETYTAGEKVKKEKLRGEL